MTLREIIAAGAKLDDEIWIEAHTYNNCGEKTDIYFSYSENINITIEKNSVTIIANVQPVN